VINEHNPTMQKCGKFKIIHLVHNPNKMLEHEAKHYHFKIWHMLKNDLGLTIQWFLLRKHYFVVEGV
jgi:hypothetical protein